MRYLPAKIEKKWQEWWLKEKIYESDLKKTRRPFYNLMMFPYPSAEGLHIGAVRTFTGVDIYGRFKRMQRYDVFEPIGLDGFGIHSENYALKIGKHPAEHAKDSEKNFYRQLGTMGNGFAWDERLETYDPEYYKWTQWIFVQMFKQGLAYRKKAAVNWCPSCKTVLADEQVILARRSFGEGGSGECERCGTKVIKRELEQWFFKITDYAERLLKNLDKIDWSLRVKIAQRNWIGRSEGALIKFRIVIVSEAPAPTRVERGEKQSQGIAARPAAAHNNPHIEVFTTRPDTLFGATYIVLSPEYSLIHEFESQIENIEEVKKYIKQAGAKSEEERIVEGREKTGVELKGIKAINPANGEEISVWIADYVFAHVGTGAIMAVPAHDQRDFEFAQKFNLPIKIVICPHYPEPTCPILDRAYEEEGYLVDSGKFKGMDSRKAQAEITKFVGGEKKTQYRLRDWLISRQRYWGPPIPMIFCEVCLTKGLGKQRDMPGWYAVPEKDLPVKLPYIKNFRPTGTDKSPLATVEKFYKARCPKCRSWARRETDVSDSFLDSSWYFLRYPSVRDTKHAWSRDITKKWLPVDMYIGGAEHSVLHLLYSRFITMAFYDFGLLDFEEPFTVFRAHGLITKDGIKMSKSRGNVVNPDKYIAAYGADAIRMYLAFIAPFEQGGDFRDAGIKGITRFLERVWRLSFDVVARLVRNDISNEAKRPREIASSVSPPRNGGLTRLLNKTIKKVTEDIEELQYNTAISALMILLNEFDENIEAVTPEHFSVFLRLLAPFAPHMTEELWQQLQSLKKFRSIHKESWPKYNSKLIQEETFELVVQINGKVRDKFVVPVDISEAEATRLTLVREKVTIILGTKKPRKAIFIPKRLINIVF